MNKRFGPFWFVNPLKAQPQNTIKSKRKYPVKVDETGRSARSRAFEAYDSGKRPAQILVETGISMRTACRYFADWKRLPKNFRILYKILRSLVKNDVGVRETTVDMISARLEIPKDEVIRRLQIPHGLFELMTDSYQAPQVRLDRPRERRLVQALKLFDMLEQINGIDRKDMKTVVDELQQVINKAREKYGRKIPDNAKSTDPPTHEGAKTHPASKEVHKKPLSPEKSVDPSLHLPPGWKHITL